MQRQYARTYEDFWTSRIMSLDDTCRALAHFLYSAKHVNVWGLYYKPVKAIAVEFQRPDATVRTALRKLSGIEFVEVDEETGFVWVRELCSYQLRPLPLKPGNVLIKTARRWYSSVARNPFLGPWWDRYAEELLLDSPDTFPEVQATRRDWISRVPAQVGLLEPAPVPPVGVERRKLPANPARPDDFVKWFAHYPAHRQQKRKAALDAWLAKKIPPHVVDAMIEKLERQKRSIDWQKEGGQFVPLAHNYLKDERWNDNVGREAGTALNRTNQRTADNLRDLIDAEIDD